MSLSKRSPLKEAAAPAAGRRSKRKRAIPTPIARLIAPVPRELHSQLKCDLYIPPGDYLGLCRFLVRPAAAALAYR